jgi:hypothetical protein
MNTKLTKVGMRQCLVLFLLLFFMTTVQAELKYVGDTLRVGVRAEADRSLPSNAVIVTGMAVEVLENNQDFSRIRTADGIEGWVKSSYLMSRKPAQIVLDEVRKNQQALQSELDSLHKAQAAALDADDSLQALQDNVSKLIKENRELGGVVAGAAVSDDSSWLYWFSGILAVGPLGFLFGLLWYRYQIMKKLGGLTL